MEIRSDDDQLFFMLEPYEMILFEHELREVAKLYEAEPDSLKPGLNERWYNPDTALSDRQEGSGEEVEYWKEALRGSRLSRLDPVLRWCEELSSMEEQGRKEWCLPFTEVEMFLQVLNDRRLALALMEGITEKDMDLDIRQLDVETDPRVEILSRIHLLALLMEVVVDFLEDK